jgi:hypothetical protein
VLFGILLWATPSLSADVKGTCTRERAAWEEAYGLMKAAAEDYRQIKEGSITPLIEKEIAAKGQSQSSAAVVRSVLQTRAQRMSEVREKLDPLMVEEKRSFDRLKKCVSRSRRTSRRGSSRDAEERERKRVVAGLSDLLLDEAYDQYKNERPRSASRSNDYQSGPSSWQRYYGGYGRARQQYPMPRYPNPGYFRR